LLDEATSAVDRDPAKDEHPVDPGLALSESGCRKTTGMPCPKLS
jgi:hypothetical protein